MKIILGKPTFVEDKETSDLFPWDLEDLLIKCVEPHFCLFCVTDDHDTGECRSVETKVRLV